MDIRKFKQLHDLIINEDEAQARELFHEIVVEKSREIFESIMTEDMMDEDDMEEGHGKMGGQVGDLLDEINAEESGVMEGDEDESDIEFDDGAEEAGDDLTHDLEMDHDEGGEEAEHAEIEDAVIRIEDKLDQLMAEFEQIMDAEGVSHDEEGEESPEEMGDEEDEMDEDMMMENVNLPKVPSPKHGDDGAQKKSTVAFNSGQAGMASKPVKFSGDAETVPTGPKGPSNAYTKGEKDVKGAGQWKNTPGKNNFKDEGDSAPKPVTKDGSSNHKSPVAK